MGNIMTDKDRITALEKQVADMKREFDERMASPHPSYTLPPIPFWNGYNPWAHKTS